MIFFRRKLKKRDVAREKVLRKFEKKIGYRFNSLDILNTALTHPSYLNENQIKDQAHYERMEFLGDAVLGLIVCAHIYKEFPHYNEGNLSDIKSHVVSEKSLAAISKRMELGKYLLFGPGEARTGGRRKNSIMANAFESVLGAIFLDGGYEKAKKYILRFTKDDIVLHPPNRDASNFKGMLQKQCQLLLTADPNYRIVGEKGPSHSRIFEIEVWARERKLGKGEGRSKKDAEQKAALDSLKYLDSKKFKKLAEKMDVHTKKSRSRKRKGKRRPLKQAMPDKNKA